MNVNIQSIHFKADTQLLDYIEKRVNKLDKYFDRITDIDIKLRMEKTGQIQDKIVEYNLRVPGETLVSKSSDKTFETAADDAYNILKRQIKRYKEKMRNY